MQIKHLARLIVVYCLFAGCASSHHANRQVSSYEPTPMEKVESAISEYRSSLGLNKLKTYSALQRAAQKHAEYLAKQMVLSHDDQDGDIEQRVLAEGAKFEIVSEVINCGTDDATVTLEAWKKSKSHNKVITYNDLQYVGVGFQKIDSDAFACNYIWVIDFGGNSPK
ncbi:MAG: CAP domain-containing protein [Bdellovibrionales bacterium]|nr:CAP domain-containing protein [Bdellovibrionales bacterium]